MKTVAIIALLIMTRAVDASSIPLDLSRTQLANLNTEGLWQTATLSTSQNDIVGFVAKMPSASNGIEICALMDDAGCSIGSLMATLNDAVSAGIYGTSLFAPGPKDTAPPSASRVPVPGAIGLFGSALIATVAIRRRRRAA